MSNYLLNIQLVVSLKCIRSLIDRKCADLVCQSIIISDVKNSVKSLSCDFVTQVVKYGSVLQQEDKADYCTPEVDWLANPTAIFVIDNFLI